MENEQEGTITLDPEMLKAQEEAKAKQAAKIEKMKAINIVINETVNKLADDLGLKVYLGAYHPEEDESGIWKSKNVNTMEEVGLSELFSKQFQ